MLHLTRIVAGILVLLGLSLGAFAWHLARSPGRAAEPTGTTPAAAAAASGRPVVVAARPLPAGRALEAADLRIDRLAVASSAALDDPAPLVGRVPVTDLPEGMPLALALFSSGLAQRLAPGERAVAVHVDETIGVGHQVRPGDFVDVHLVLKRDGGEVDQSLSRLLLARNRVLAYGSASVDGPLEGIGAPAVAGRQELARTVVLAVPADRIDQLTLSETQGRLFLALRHPQDEAGADVPPQAERAGAADAARRGGALPGHTLRQLAGHGAAPMAAAANPPAAAAPGVAPAVVRRAAVPGEPAGSRVEIIRGSTQETAVY
jgi:pilus assembly protein CpaB